MWEGVGHLKAGGFGTRNQFGQDFRTFGMVYMCLFLFKIERKKHSNV